MFQTLRSGVFRATSRLTSLFRQNLPVRHQSERRMDQALKLLTIDPACHEQLMRGLVLGVYADPQDKYDMGILTPTAWRYNVENTDGNLLDKLRMSGPLPKVGEIRMFYGVEKTKNPEYPIVVVAGLGKECQGFHPYEMIDEQKESIRRAVAAACTALCSAEVFSVNVESMGHAESAAEGAVMAIWAYQELRQANTRIYQPQIEFYTRRDEVCDVEGWKIGIQKASAQNLARQLQEAPSNILTPNAFAQTVVDVLCKTGINVEVKVEGWAQSQSMNAFLAVSKASCQPPIFLELSYYGAKSDERPIVLIGQGVTYDSGGLCPKDKKTLKIMRADMTGAAVVVATCRAIAALRLPLNVRGLIPLCENMPGCNAFKPGDIVRSMDGRTIEIEGTDQEDVLVLADTLLYAQNFCPKMIVDIGTCSYALGNLIGEVASGVYTNSEILWQQIKHASIHTGDRVWRLPLWKYYSDKMKNSPFNSAYIQNYGMSNSGLPCKAAGFLKNFVPCGQWLHIDTTSTVVTKGDYVEYLRRGMSGRPTRTLIEFIAQTLCKENYPKLSDQHEN